MATDLTGLTGASIGISVRGTAEKEASDEIVATDPLSQSRSVALTFGTGASKANQVYHARITLAGGATSELDLYGGTLLNGFGVGCAFRKIKSVTIVNRSDEQAVPTTAQVTVGGSAENAWEGNVLSAAGTFLLEPGDVFARASKVADGLGVVDATHKMLLLTNEDAENGAEIEIEIFGENA